MPLALKFVIYEFEANKKWQNSLVVMYSTTKHNRIWQCFQPDKSTVCVTLSRDPKYFISKHSKNQIPFLNDKIEPLDCLAIRS